MGLLNKTGLLVYIRMLDPDQGSSKYAGNEASKKIPVNIGYFIHQIALTKSHITSIISYSFIICSPDAVLKYL